MKKKDFLIGFLTLRSSNTEFNEYKKIPKNANGEGVPLGLDFT
jgi:hypothetical protein